MLDTIPNPVFYKGIAGQYLGCNQAFTDYFGGKRDGIVGKTVYDLFSKELADQTEKKDLELFAHPGTQFYESRTKRKDGAIRDILVSKATFTDMHGDVQGLIGVISDITTRIQAEAKIRKLSQVVDQSPVSVVITNLAGEIEYVNPRFTQLTGYSFEEIKGQTPSVLKSGKHSTEFYRRLWQTLKSGKEWRGEFCNRKKDGELYWETASISPMRDHEGEITHFIAVKEDITERKATQKAIEDSHDEIERLLSSISSILIGISDDGRVTRWNKSAESAFGMHSVDIMGHSFRQCHIKWDWDALVEKLSSCREKAKPVELNDFRYTRRDGKEAFIALTINPVLRERDADRGFLILGNDITERKQLEGQLSQAQKLESIGRLAAGIAHEINTPIQYVGAAITSGSWIWRS
jgi:PAS domain S-box-containing protein